MKTAVVKFPTSSTLYHYRTELDLQEGDHVVVDSPTSGYTVAVVRKVIDDVSLKATAFIVCKVDDTAYKARKESKLRRARIVKQLREIQKQQTEIEQFAALANANPQAALLVAELRTLVPAEALDDEDAAA